jgi:hypothetical protein
MAGRARTLLIALSRWAAAGGAIALAATACRAVTGVDDYQTDEPACSGADCSSGGGEAPSPTGSGGSGGTDAAASSGRGGGPDAVASGSSGAAQATGATSSSTGCTPRGCGGEPPACGTIEDGCGSSVVCADCTAPASCVDGSCCVLLTCATMGCQYVGSDGCGGTLDCTCTPPATCEVLTNTCSCQPGSCESLGIECGQAQDACGDFIFCGGCGPGCSGGCRGGICDCGGERPEPP